MNYSSTQSQEQSFQLEPMFGKMVIGLLHMESSVKKHPKTVLTFVENVQALLSITKIGKAELAKRSGISTRYIDHLLKYERYPTIRIAEDVAKAFGINGWQILMPKMRYDLAKSGKLEEIISEFSESSQTTQDYVSEVLHRELKNGTQ